MKFLVSEIFHSIQGEGNYAGVNSLFIRFQLCNLACKWCDTKYTWSRRSGMFREYDEADLKKIIRESEAHHFIFTGGEPALYNIDKLVVPGKKFHVESSGTIHPGKPLDIILQDGVRIRRSAMSEKKYSRFNWVISPKLANSGQTIKNALIGYWAKKDHAILKFVIQSKKDLDEVAALEKKYRIRKEKIFICFEGTTLESQMQPALAEEIIGRGWNYSPRLHVILWGNERKR